MDTEKECSRCKNVKTAEMFYPCKKGKGGLRHYCKVCEKEMEKIVRDSGNRVRKPASVKALEKFGSYYSKF